MNVLPNILQYGSSGTSGTSGESQASDYVNNFPVYIDPVVPVEPPPSELSSSQPSFLSKLYGRAPVQETPVFTNEPLIYVAAPDPVDPADNQSFMSKLFANANHNTSFTNSPVVCAANPCPIILNATCVFYEGPNLIYTKINTNDNLQTALEKMGIKSYPPIFQLFI